ncbi:MAG: methionine--tRNA ligase [bacterium]|nr:methionine--tRNA ligase [bacterium]
METERKKFYITTAIPYVNARPHIGFALELIQTDVIARWLRQQGGNVRFLTGTDENALKNVQAAEEAGRDTGEFVAEHAQLFKDLLKILDISNDDFIRTSAEERHIKGAQKLWSSCKPDDIYKKVYKGLYCLGCEEFKLEKDLMNGECSEHPGKKLQEVEEENYFFRLSGYQDRILKLVEDGTMSIIPEGRRNETISFIKSGLEDFSISRSRERAKHWGIEVPGDPSQIMYVWFDALSNYINALGYAETSEDFRSYWEQGETLHVIGKGINRFHAVYWPAMLLSANIALPKKIFIHGYITVDGQKMSKTIGNVIDPVELVGKYGVDPVRYYLLREISSSEDGDFSYKKFEERYNGDLANGLGNLVARVATLGETISPIEDRGIQDGIRDEHQAHIASIGKRYESYMQDFRLNEALACTWELVSFADKFINDRKPWTMKENKDELVSVILPACRLIEAVANFIVPFLPDTSMRIREQIIFHDGNIEIKKGAGLFPRLAKSN